MNMANRKYTKPKMSVKTALTIAIITLQSEATQTNDKIWKAELSQAVRILRQHKRKNPYV